jgi:hypothetical protein
LAPAPALAGAWDPPAAGQVIVQVAQVEQNDADQTEAQVYAETPAPGGGARVGKLWLRYAPDADETRFEVMAGRRWRFEAPASAAAVQGVLVARGEVGADTDLGAEARLLGGWDLGDGIYVGAEAGVQLFETGPEARLEATLGRTAGRSLSFLQIRYDQDSEGLSYARGEAALVLFTTGGVGVQIGVRTGLDHDEHALTIGLWRTAAPR